MIGTPKQIAWAIQIQSQVQEEFDRVRNVLEYAAAKGSHESATDIQAIIGILEDKRAEVMKNEEAGYFIDDWQDPAKMVARLVTQDSRYEAIKASQMARLGPGSVPKPGQDSIKPGE